MDSIKHSWKPFRSLIAKNVPSDNIKNDNQREKIQKVYRGKGFAAVRNLSSSLNSIKKVF